MKLEQSFEVAAPLERVWQTLIDVEHVAPCLPGAAVTGRNEDGSYNGTFTVKIGPTTASYTGKLEMENIDETSHTATMQAQGTDKRGQGGAKATINSRLAPVDGRGTRVEVVTDYHITGKLARFGRGGMIEDISQRLLREFAKRLQSSLAEQPGADVAPVESAAAAEPAAAEPVPSAEPTQSGESAPSAEPGAPEEARTRTRTDWVSPSTDAAAPPSPEGAPTAAGPPMPPTPEPAAPSAPAPPAVAPPPPASAAETRPPLAQPPTPSEPMQGLSLVGSVLWMRIKRNPAPAAAAGVAVVLLLARLRRRRRGH
jgi:carbon monoxide dehydrogenase subunit G